MLKDTSGWEDPSIYRKTKQLFKMRFGVCYTGSKPWSSIELCLKVLKKLVIDEENNECRADSKTNYVAGYGIENGRAEDETLDHIPTLAQ